MIVLWNHKFIGDFPLPCLITRGYCSRWSAFALRVQVSYPVTVTRIRKMSAFWHSLCRGMVMQRLPKCCWCLGPMPPNSSISVKPRNQNHRSQREMDLGWPWVPLGSIGSHWVPLGPMDFECCLQHPTPGFLGLEQILMYWPRPLACSSHGKCSLSMFF